MTARRGNTMDMGLYREIVDEARTIEEIDKIILQGLGEPLLDKALEERIKYAKGIETVVFSNGVLLTKDRFNSLIDSGLDALVISLNALNQEQHENVMGVKGKFEQVVSICDYIAENKPKDFNFSVHAVFDSSNFTIDDAIAFNNRWGRKGKVIKEEKWGDRYKEGYGQVVLEGNWAGDNSIEYDRTLKPADCCERAITQMYVLWDGRVTMCCFDQDGDTVFGDLSKQGIREVYNSERYTQFREDHWNNKADRYEACNHCTRI